MGNEKYIQNLLKQDRQCTFCLILWSLRVTIVATETEKFRLSLFFRYICLCQQWNKS